MFSIETNFFHEGGKGILNPIWFKDVLYNKQWNLVDASSYVLFNFWELNEEIKNARWGESLEILIRYNRKRILFRQGKVIIVEAIFYKVVFFFFLLAF